MSKAKEAKHDLREEFSATTIRMKKRKLSVVLTSLDMDISLSDPYQ
jgi:hypothetical protein